MATRSSRTISQRAAAAETTNASGQIRRSGSSGSPAIGIAPQRTVSPRAAAATIPAKDRRSSF